MVTYFNINDMIPTELALLYVLLDMRHEIGKAAEVQAYGEAIAGAQDFAEMVAAIREAAF